MFGTFDFETTWGFKAFDLHALRTRTGAPVATQAAAKAASSAPVAICSGNHGRFSEYKALYFCVCVCACVCVAKLMLYWSTVDFLGHAL